VEYVTILVFACFGVVLFANIDQQGISGQDAFLSFKKAFISLYALSLTVNDPDVYLVSDEGWGAAGREGERREERDAYLPLVKDEGYNFADKTHIPILICTVAVLKGGGREGGRGREGRWTTHEWYIF